MAKEPELPGAGAGAAGMAILEEARAADDWQGKVILWSSLFHLSTGWRGGHRQRAQGTASSSSYRRCPGDLGRLDRPKDLRKAQSMMHSMVHNMTRQNGSHGRSEMKRSLLEQVGMCSV